MSASTPTSVESAQSAKRAKKDKKQEQRQKNQEALSTFFKDTNQKDYSKNLTLKPDHTFRPCWVCADNHIFLETFSPIYRQAYDFLVTIAEPVSRPEHIHEYVLTESSLYAAVSIGLDTDQIIKLLNDLSKTDLSKDVEKFIRECTSSYGKVKLVLHKNTYFVESPNQEVLLKLLNDPIIKSSAKLIPPHKIEELGLKNVDPKTGLFIRYRKRSDMIGFKVPTATASSANSAENAGSSNGGADQQGNNNDANAMSVEEQDQQQHLEIAAAAIASQRNNAGNNASGSGGVEQNNIISKISEAVESLEADDDELDIIDSRELKFFSFEIDNKRVGEVKKRSIEMDLPMLEEYDFKNDTVNPNLEIDLKQTTLIRPYQAKSLSKMFSNGRARSGVIVLPCGAGKTLVGITSACTVKKSTLVLCINAVSVEQWRNQFKLWSTIDDSRIARFTSMQKDKLSGKGADIVITTYNMITFQRERNSETQKFMEQLTSREWGLMLLDEVHVVPAEMFRKVIEVIKAHCKLGLTATLLREDNKTEDLFYLIGPKLYEANWLDLQRSGHLAKVQCVEVWCPMTYEFYSEYLRCSQARKKLLYVMNPNKYRACEFLIKTHEQRGDKIIVFSDNVYALNMYAKKMGKPFIYGDTHQRERMQVLNAFQKNPKVNCVFISKIGDTAIDLPEANVIIQISSHFGSRRQETQRLGRILRPKPTKGRSYLVDGGSANAYFYTLVSQDTMEMFYSAKRQQFLIDQGYSYQVINNLHHMYNDPGYGITLTGFVQKQEELDLLSDVMKAEENAGESEKVKVEDDVLAGSSKPAKRSRGSMSSMSGGSSGLVYAETRSSGKKAGAGGAASTVGAKNYASKHPLFKKRLREVKKK